MIYHSSPARIEMWESSLLVIIFHIVIITIGITDKSSDFFASVINVSKEENPDSCKFICYSRDKLCCWSSPSTVYQGYVQEVIDVMDNFKKNYQNLSDYSLLSKSIEIIIGGKINVN